MCYNRSMSMKILSPAGDFESLKMAVYNGADEVYLGVKDFNARNIEGFSLSTLKEAVDFAHIFDVKVNLTVNILFADEEMQSALDLIVDAYNLGVDAFIVQDVGLASLVHVNYPQIELHASTQMGLHNLEGVKIAENLGFKRIVLSRETPLEEIKRIRENTTLEIEYFCQGALCVSFSGNCYFSSYEHNASGNRGKCKQLCRLPYSLCFDDKEIKNGYLLSAKDFNMLDRLQDLKEAGVDVLKIEGRARRPYYVGVATKIYKQALKHEKYDIEELELAFNRGYTEGYFNGNGDIISNRQNHMGIEIGKVKNFKSGKKFNEVYIFSNKEINSKSVLKFIDKDDEVVITAYDLKKVGKEYKITTTQNVKVGAKVYLISDFEKEQELLNYKTRKKVKVEIVARVGKQIEAWIDLFNEKFLVLGEVCGEAKNQPITFEDLKLNFNKSDLFEVELETELEKVFLTKQKLNEFRRNVLEKIKEIILSNNRKELNKINSKLPKKLKEFINFIEIYDNFNEFFNNFNEFFNKNKKINEKNIIYCPSEYNLKDIEEFIYVCKNHNKKPILNLPNFALQQDVDMLKQIVEKTKITIVANNLYALNFDTEKIIGGGLNVYNSYTANYFNLPFIKAEGGNYKAPYMTMRHCPMKQHLSADCTHCPFKNGYYYKMQNGKKLKLKRVKMSTCTFCLTD